MNTRKEILEKMVIADAITSLVMRKLGWFVSTDGVTIKERETNMEIGWDDNGAVTIEPISYNNNIYTQLNIWGDGTLEIQDNEGESLNWGEFDKELLNKILMIFEK